MAGYSTEKTALLVLNRLREAGFEALFAGGCVRDMLLGRKCSDYDVATNATPDDVRKLFRRVLLVGAKFGVAIVLYRKQRVEVAAFRSDLSYSDGRRPDGVKPSSPKADALRRDFTINGMFYDPIARKVIDYVRGREDLKKRVVRTIGKPAERFREDYLRMIRAVRFTVRLGFRMDDATAGAIGKYAENIRRISGERIFDELTRMLSDASAAEALDMLDRLGLAEYILPELFESDSAWPAAVARVRAVCRDGDGTGSLAALLADMGRRKISKKLRRWGASNELRDALVYIGDHLAGWRAAAETPLCEFKRMMASGQFERLTRLWRYEERLVTGKITLSRRIAGRAAKIPKDKIAPPPFVTGSDLLKMGLAEGPRLGKILRTLYDAQLNEQIATRREALGEAKKQRLACPP